MIILRSLIYGTTAVLSSSKFDAAQVVREIDEHKITVVSLVPTMLKRVLDAGLTNPTHLRFALIGGGPLDADLVDRAASVGVQTIQAYGLTETGSMVTVSSIGSDPRSVGHPVPGINIKVAVDGEILVSGPMVAASSIAGDGFLHTGDLGHLTGAGLRVLGRKSDTIITGGENVAPQEIEEILRSHPAIREAAVFGRKHPEWGEAIAAKVILRPDERLHEDELRHFCGQRLARYKIPKEIEEVESLPLTSSGKLSRRDLV
jgi:O-succinylbenzoic acid--CoA ligase